MSQLPLPPQLSSRVKRALSWLIGLALLVAVLWAFREELDFISQGLGQLRHAHRGAVAVVVSAAVLSLVAMAYVMALLIRAGGVPVSLAQATAITFASNAWSTTLPAGPAFSAALTFAVQRSWGASAALCAWFLVLSAAVSTVWLVVIGLVGVVLLGAKISISSLIVSIVIMVSLTWLTFWAANHPETLRAWLLRRRLVRHRLRPKQREALLRHISNLGKVHLTATQFSAVAFFSLANRALDMLALWACVWAATGDIPGFSSAADRTTLAGVALAYITAKLAGSAQITPAGLGTVEAAIIATLVATGMTAVSATAAAVVYRLISFAAMTLVGWIIYAAVYARRGLTYRSLSAALPSQKGTS